MTPDQLRELLEKDAERFHIEFGMLAPTLLELWRAAEMLRDSEYEYGRLDLEAALTDLENA